MLASLERPTPHAGKTLPQLDALRGVAILAVFTQHLGDRFLPLVRSAIETHVPASIAAWILTILHHAWWGVDLFFVLSGFSLALSWFRSGGQSARTFFIRRAARILPAYYVALAVTLLFHRSIILQKDFAAALFMHALVLQGYFPIGGIVFIGATWSLTTEISFYILFPWLARLVSSPKRHLVLGACALVLTTWLVRSILHDWSLEPGLFAGMLEATQRRWIVSRLDQFLLGALAARVFVLLEHSSRAARLAPLALGMCFPALIAAFRLEGAYYFELGGSHPYALLSLVTTAIVLSACLCRGRLVGAIAPRPLVFTGIVSYGVFLYHQLALGLCDFEPLAPPSWTNLARTSILALGLSLLVGYASWIFIEKPMMKRMAVTTSPPPAPVRVSTPLSE
ncbi:MAG: acyltransferase [Polyangiaceae bacterium]|nr:acyltransferase [Polyangiaceae bacterium]